MPLYVKGTMVSDSQGNTELDLNSIVISEILAALTANEIGLYVGASVGIYRQNEINNGWYRLAKGIQDRGIMREFAPGFIYTQYPVDDMSEAGRTTSGVFTEIAADSIGIGIGSAVKARFLDWVTPVETGFEKLRDAARDLYLKAA